ncbi:MAG: Asp-tRNA(Asn)/Glu-tRNA(Gln) amidotransferase subunit GatA [Chloroflexi bacterium CFX7]|nr:Asp-tRNA(Asn)/Glu-tRNA(Gln) amidotransferase subunit GatA [Chloroflexi bacterium CFX7]MCK6564156.1 Asp-tRNA(Asn)/Glu-tRNA(Gln) amidotransferase subunit GatA [Dehalococcoidia bacterium]MCL4231274.1 Asp-tRNA(Asn)/Glu-tRNA(Gln) amidotransferase subunit GatA [Dehalococcoidia bacterium]RIL02114.1 MAG: Asp-tRNA(Asn)/Glu-tRNA(Gln) amidotransferase GatCAB subunit A [bacterium]
MNELWRLTAHEAHEKLRSKEFTAVELTRSVLERMAAVEERVHAYITPTPDLALEQAREADARFAAGTATPLTGIPVAVKDIIVTKGVRTTAGSKILGNFVPPYDSHVNEQLRRAGAVMAGKANMDEFAMGSSTEHSAFGPTRNPWNLNLVPGGSSGGSAAAVSAGECLVALGSDTGGSIRQPAALCGVVGIDPTYGRVSRYGIIAFGSSLDQVGPLGRDVEDAATMLDCISGHDPRDSTTNPEPVPDLRHYLGREIKGMRVGVPREYFIEGMEPGVKARIEEALRLFEELGCHVDRDLSLPSTEHALAVYYLIAPSEASANLARYDGVKYGFSDRTGGTMWENMEQTRARGFGEEVKRRIMLGTYALSAGYYDAYYLKAQKVRTLICREFAAAFEKYDIIVTPTSPTVAFPIGAKTDDPFAMYLNDVYTLPSAVAGLPAISIPCGLSEGLPTGLQIIGNFFDEGRIVSAAHAFERAFGWANRLPAL